MKGKRIFTLFLASLLVVLTSCSQIGVLPIPSREKVVDTDVTDLPPFEESIIATQDLNIGYDDNPVAIGNDILNPSDWMLHYPSGTESGGMLIDHLDPSYSSKYCSRSDNYVKLALDAQDKGKSANGNAVRTELRSVYQSFYFSGTDQISGTKHEGTNAEFDLTFKTNSTQADIADYCLCQALLNDGYDYSTGKNIADKPFFMISVVRGEIIAAIRTNTRSYVDGSFCRYTDASSYNYSLGKIANMQEVNLKVDIHDRKFDVYRDGVKMVDSSFLPEQDSLYGGYFKAGIYYGVKPTDSRITYLFTEVYIKNISLKIS